MAARGRVMVATSMGGPLEATSVRAVSGLGARLLCPYRLGFTPATPPKHRKAFGVMPDDFNFEIS